jgi:precorrin-8X/cobalt-precorrin-8 methylmutase
MKAYLADPGAIERESFRLIREQTDLERFSADEAQVAMRMVHTCGDPKVVGDLHFSADATSPGVRAFTRGTPVLCDVEMVRQGVSRRFCSGEVHCFLNAAGVAERARSRCATRSMTALDFWAQHLDGSVAVVGNAPTALFRLLELLDNGAPRPALVIGMPVGFVGAVESKQALMEQAPKLGVDWITLTGRRGGSALAVSVVNALARLAQGVRC